MGEKYNLIFEGKIVSGFNEKDVRQKISNLLKIPEAQQNAFFSGRPIELKKDLTMDQALRLKQQLGNYGIEVLMVSTAFAGLSLVAEKTVAPDTSSIVQERSLRREPSEAAQKRREQYRAEYDQMAQSKEDEDTSDPYRAPSPFGLSFKGRYGRMSYFNAILIWFVGVVMLTLAIALLMGIRDENSGVFSILSIVYSFCTYRIAVLRAHDMNLSGWFCLLLFVPILNFVLSVCLLFVQGTEGENSYGAEPNQGSFNVIVLIAVIILLVILFH